MAGLDAGGTGSSGHSHVADRITDAPTGSDATSGETGNGTAGAHTDADGDDARHDDADDTNGTHAAHDGTGSGTRIAGTRHNAGGADGCWSSGRSDAVSEESRHAGAEDRCVHGVTIGALRHIHGTGGKRLWQHEYARCECAGRR